jgi:hypothetical protein
MILIMMVMIDVFIGSRSVEAFMGLIKAYAVENDGKGFATILKSGIQTKR